jgi:hypothetical protein
MNCYLFILAPNRSGTTILSRIIESSPHVTSLPTEGHHMSCWNGLNQNNFTKHGVFTLDQKKLSLEESYNWEGIKKCFHKNWGNEPIKHQKTPSDLCRIELMEKFFNPCYWISNLRNPLENAISILNLRPERTAEEIGTHLNHCYQVIENKIKAKNVCLITYEELCENPQAASKKVVDFLPEIECFEFDLTRLMKRSHDNIEEKFKKTILEKIEPSRSFLKENGYSKVFQ